MKSFAIGQRWISEMEPELGLGIVKHIDKRFVEIHFPASDCELKYAISSAPLKRVEFKTGDMIKSRDGQDFTISSTSIESGIITYFCENTVIPENELSDFLSFTTPQDRLINGFIDKNRDFNLRYRSLQNQYQIRKSNIRGFIGGRVDLIPHQLYVAHEIASWPIPRVLLSDETGLGKTIEVCLVLHRLLINGRINRVLILVPNSLVHQWFVELLRRFNLIFRIFDEEYCKSIESSDPATNPFLEDQLGLCSIDFLSSQEKWKRRAVTAKWDMLVIDEAHHLTGGSPDYLLAKELSQVSRGLMLLTATPEQLGHQSHFERLRLLDPARYHDFTRFEREETQYLKISGLINKFLQNDQLNKNEAQLFAELIPQNLNASSTKDEKIKNQIIGDILDRYGTGRAVFRNTRTTMSGFPKRLAHLIPLQGSSEDLENQTREYEADQNHQQKFLFNYKNDARINWLIKLLKKNKDQKVLLICHSKEKVKAIEETLRNKVKVNIALFHEDYTLLQRDRNAAWFAREDGAQILVCSEIGSEGRNFQFSHNLVLFDLPLDPELLEQRIGRLDRIGQKEDINIYIPYFTGSEYEILASWYSEGLNAFVENVPGVYQIYQYLKSELTEIILEKDPSRLEKLLLETQTQKSEITQKMKDGRDRLLELNSFRSDVAQNLEKEIKAVDSKKDLEKYMLDLFHLFGIREDMISDRLYKLNLELLSSPEFPLPPLKTEQLIVTFDRKTALSHEDIEFLSWDHPMVSGVMELLLGSEKGNCTVALWVDPANQEILLEGIFILECVAPKSLYADRFLPPTPIRVVVNHSLQDCGENYSTDRFTKHLKNSQDMGILENPQVRQELFPNMLSKCKELAESSIPEIIGQGITQMETSLYKEVNRLKELKKVNKNIRQEEITILEDEMELLKKVIQKARLRLDSLRFIFRGEV